MQQYTFQARQTSSFHNEGKWCYLQMFLFFHYVFKYILKYLFLWELNWKYILTILFEHRRPF